MTTKELERRLTKIASQLAPERRVFIVQAGSKEEIDRELEALKPSPGDGVLTITVEGRKGPPSVQICN